MELFHKKDDQLTRLEETSFTLEKDIQKITELNVQTIFGLQFISSEFALNELRIDTLAFDNETSAFVIIEYKKDKNYSVIDQGYAYLGLLLNNKAEFILEYQKQTGKNIAREKIDWTQSRVLFIAPSFTTYQQKAINFRDLPIELWEIKKYNDLLIFNQLLSPESSASISTISPGNEVIKNVSREVKVYTEEEHLTSVSKDLQELYERLKRNILELGDDIHIVARKMYIAFKHDTNFVDIEFQKSRVKLYLNLKKGKLDDPRKIARDISGTGHWGTGDYELLVTLTDDLTYVMTLVKQAYDKSKK